MTESGCVNVKVSKESNGTEIIATKPEWEVGASQALKMPLKTSKMPVWSLQSDDVEDDIEEDDNLLVDEDYKKPNTSNIIIDKSS